jgi:hypothetical protein
LPPLLPINFFHCYHFMFHFIKHKLQLLGHESLGVPVCFVHLQTYTEILFCERDYEWHYNTEQAHLEIMLQTSIQVFSSNSWDTGHPEVFHGFSQSLKTYAGILPCLGHGHFLPYPFQFISHPIIWCYIVSILKALLNDPWKEEHCNCH